MKWSDAAPGWICSDEAAGTGGSGGQAVSWERAYGITDESYATAAWGDMPDMTITKTTGANPVELSFSAGVGNSSNNSVGKFRLMIDGVVVGTETKVRTPSASVGPHANLIWIENVSAGSHIFKVQWYAESGTVYNRAAAGSEHRTFIVKEFLGGSNGGLGNGEVERVVLTSGDVVGTTATDLTGLTMTKELIAGREYEWRFQSTGAKTTTGNLYLLITDGSGNVLSTTVESIQGGYASSQEVVYRETGTGATVTRKIQAYANVGAYTFYAGPDYSSTFSLDDITQDSVALNNLQWQDANLEWYVGGTLVTLDASSSQRYINQNGVVTIKARLVSNIASNLTGLFELRNLPVTPINTVNEQLLGFATWRNEGVGHYAARPMYALASNSIHLIRYNDYVYLSDTVSSSPKDSIDISISYEVAQ